MSPPHALPPRALKATGLACRRGERLLFEELELELGAGELLLLRGANGSGKTTLLQTLAGIRRPDRGRVDVLGGDGEALHLLGHVNAVSARLTVAENLAFWADVCGGDSALAAPALAAVELEALGDLEAGLLSAGQSRRLALGRLLCAERPIWLLDEPTAALDSAGAALVTTLIDTHLRRGGLVVAATHHDITLPGSAVARTLRLGT